MDENMMLKYFLRLYAPHIDWINPVMPDGVNEIEIFKQFNADIRAQNDQGMPVDYKLYVHKEGKIIEPKGPSVTFLSDGRLFTLAVEEVAQSGPIFLSEEEWEARQREWNNEDSD